MKLGLLVFLFAVSVHAQVDAPPNEPPYTALEDEFDKKTEAPPVELKAGEAPPPPVVNAPEPKPLPSTVVPVEDAAVVSAPSAPEKPADIPDGERVMVKHDEIVPETGSNKTFIRHPGAKDGLRLIDRDGSYYYVPTRYSKREQTSSLLIGGLHPNPDIVSEDGVTNYSTMYGSSTPTVVSYNYDWLALKGFGAMGVQLGFGLLTAQGNGHFLHPQASGITEAREKYTFYAIPLNLGGIYRFEYMDRQWVVPYVAAGATYYVLAEMRDDGKTPNFVGTPSAYGGGGAMFNLSALDKETGFAMDAEYGISTLWLTVDARYIQASNPDLNMGGSLISVGISADY